MRDRRIFVGLAVACALSTVVPVTAARSVEAQQPQSAQQPLDERVLPREVADEVLRTWNAPGTLRLDGPYTIVASREVTGDVAVVGGTLTIEGRVIGRVVAVNADVHLAAGARVDGDVLAVGGRVTGTDVATVTGQVRTYRARLDYARDGDRMSRPGQPDLPWWRRRQRRQDGGWGDVRLISARTYNRVEGLPIYLGPAFGRDFSWGRAAVDAFGVWRSADGFEWKPENIGHSLKTELQLGAGGGLRVGGRLFDLVEPVESWHLSDGEVGLASVLLHRDFRDYFDKHGGALYGQLFRGPALDLTVNYADVRWGDRRTRDPWTLFRNSQPWRANPILDEGAFHLINATLRYDTRNDKGNPWSGWYLLADYEYGTGRVSQYGIAAPGTRTENLDGRTVYDRLFVDLRRYNRVSPEVSVNMRLAAGGWLSGDDLPLQRRFSVGGPGTLPGYDFRRTIGARDVWQCSTTALADASYPIGRPALCERFALAQVEFRGDLNLDPFGVLDEEREHRRAGWGRSPEWVVFADAGRGWLVGEPDGGLSYRSGTMPRLSTFRADVGVGLVLDDIGIYLAKAVSDGSAPLNFFVRLKPRF